MKPAVLRRRGRLAFWTLPAWESLGLQAAFFLRTGGRSRGNFRGLNLGLTVGDLAATVIQNRQAALQAAGWAARSPVLGQQVHGNRLRVVSRQDQGRGWLQAAKALPGTDGLLTIQAGLPVGITTADCLPVLLGTTGAVRAVAAIHVGWRGLAANILALAIRKMARQWRIQPARVLAALGPAIGPEAFVVRGEVLEQLRGLYPEAVRDQSRFTPAAGFDLWQAAQLQLKHAGVLDQNMVAIRECTASHPRKYFSYRRDQGKTGRMLAIIQIREN